MIAASAIIARMVRSSLLEVLGEQYITTARAKGSAERRVIAYHALRKTAMERGQRVGEAPPLHARVAPLRRELLYYAQGLKETGVLKSSTDPGRFVDRIALDLLGDAG